MSDTVAWPVAGDRVRVGDAERQGAAMALGDHFAYGRLERQEFDDRVAAAYAARTWYDLRLLFADLPGPQPAEPAGTPGSAGRPGGSAPAPGACRLRRPAVALLLVATLIFSAGTGVPLFPFVLLTLLVIRGRRWARRRSAARNGTGFQHTGGAATDRWYSR